MREPIVITPRALQIFKRVLQTNGTDDRSIDERLRIEQELSLELQLKSWEFFFGRNPWPVRYIDDESLRRQLEQVLDTIVHRSDQW